VFFPVSGWFAAFVLTILVEVPVAGWLLRRAEPDRVRLVLLVVFADLATHPIVWFVMTQLFLVGTWEYVLAAEGWAVGAEAVFYWAAFRGVSPRLALGASVAANAASWLAGIVVVTTWPGVFG
jgi:hypothetical protein